MHCYRTRQGSRMEERSPCVLWTGSDFSWLPCTSFRSSHDACSPFVAGRPQPTSLCWGQYDGRGAVCTLNKRIHLLPTHLHPFHHLIARQSANPRPASVHLNLERLAWSSSGSNDSSPIALPGDKFPGVVTMGLQRPRARRYGGNWRRRIWMGTPPIPLRARNRFASPSRSRWRSKRRQAS